MDVPGLEEGGMVHCILGATFRTGASGNLASGDDGTQRPLGLIIGREHRCVGDEGVQLRTKLQDASTEGPPRHLGIDKRCALTGGHSLQQLPSRDGRVQGSV